MTNTIKDDKIKIYAQKALYNKEGNMKKRILIALLTLVTALVAVASLSACVTAPPDKTEYTVTFNTLGGSQVAAQTVEEGGYAVEPTAPEKAGYEFGGWYLNDTTKWNFELSIQADTTLTAKWNVKDYTVSYVLGGGTNHAENPAVYTVESGAITLKNPTRNGYNFAGWKDGDNVVTEITAGSTGNKTFTAVWETIDYDIVYVLDNGVNDADNPASYTVESTITLKAPTKTGYEFTGWKDGDNTVTEITAGSTGNKTFTATWRLEQYQIIYVLIGDAENHADNPATYTVESETIILKDPTRDGFEFVGWKEGDNTVTEITAGSTGDKTLTAVWLEIYDITYVLDENGVNHPDNPATYTVESETIILKDPTRDGFKFTGWKDGNNTVTEIASGSTGDKTLTAEWAEVYNLTFDTAGGTIANATGYTVIYGEKVGELPKPTKSGHKFTGWKLNSTVITEDTVWSLESGAMLVADYVEAYTVTFTTTSIVRKQNVECSIVNIGSIVLESGESLETLTIMVAKGETLADNGIEILPTVDPIEPAGWDEYSFGGYWKYIDANGKSHKVTTDTVFNETTFGAVGEILLRPHCRAHWTPSY